MKNLIQRPDDIAVTAPSTVTSGSPVLLGKGLLGIAVDGAASAATVVIKTQGIFQLTKATGTAFAVGDAAYWDATNSRVTIVPTATYLGLVAAVAGSSDTTCNVMLDPYRRGGNTLLRTAINLVAKHDASASSNGTAMFVCFQQGGRPFLSSALGGSANIWAYLASSADAVHVTHNANPASNLGGVALYIDHDAADGFALRCVSPTALDVQIETATGRVLTVKHDASASSVGVAAYCDHDAAAAARVLFVSPGAADLNIPTSQILAGLHAL